MRASTALACLLLIACNSKPPAAPPSPAASAPPAPAAAPAAAPETGPALSLADRLAKEASSRPEGAIRLEDVVAALKEHGVSVARTRQVLGSMVGARYCAIAMTAHGLGVAACEFDSPESARAGLVSSQARFDSEIPGRQLLVNGKTLLTVAPAAAALGEESHTVTTLFASLSPRNI